MEKFSCNNLIKFTLFLIITALFSCKQSTVTETISQPPSSDNNLLVGFFEKNGDYINSKQFPSVLDAAQVYAMRKDHILVIDLRQEDHFRAGHIEHAINLQPAQVMDFFVNKIEPPAFRNIVFVCNTGMLSCYVTGVLRLLGYDNTYAMRYGMSGWDRAIAEKYWLANLGDQWEGKLEMKRNPMNQPGNLPVIEGKDDDGLTLAISKANAVLSDSRDQFMISLEELSAGLDQYYIVCYWPEEKCTSTGCLPGAVRYEPEKSLKRDGFLNTLPVNKPIVVYCNSAHQSSFVTAYLRMLGYDARTLAYGANGFIYPTMIRTEPNPRRTFMESFIQNLPLVTGQDQQPAPQTKAVEVEKTTVKGGC